MKVQRMRDQAVCTYCGARGAAAHMVVAAVRGVGYDYCDATCVAAHRQAVELAEVLCRGCDEAAVGDTGLCDEHLAESGERAPAEPWRRAG